MRKLSAVKRFNLYLDSFREIGLLMITFAVVDLCMQGDKDWWTVIPLRVLAVPIALMVIGGTMMVGSIRLMEEEKEETEPTPPIKAPTASQTAN